MTCHSVFAISLSVKPFSFSDFIVKVMVSEAVDEIGVGLPHKKIEKLEGKSLWSLKKKPLCNADTRSMQGTKFETLMLSSCSEDILLHCLHFSALETQNNSR